ncbi:30S ribosome-binding factor RbfA [Deltaproteobacteria bacterium Smac51]|nr:30S ribosome-binding factor RbfA [Deltaproteobacteria bacterium Smac51]
MSQRRLEKMSELLRETIADLLLRKSKDPRLKQINVTGVKVTADLKKAVVHYSVMGGEEQKEAVRVALAKGSRFVRAALGEALHLKYAPEIKFEFDRNLEYAQHMNDLLTGLVDQDDGERQPERSDDDDQE